VGGKNLPAQSISMSNFQKIKSAYPRFADDAELENAANELDSLQEFSLLTESPEGRKFIEQKEKQAARYLRNILTGTLEPQPLLVAIARLNATIEVIDALKGVQGQADALQETIDNIIRNA
jgi:hypothetical protein